MTRVVYVNVGIEMDEDDPECSVLSAGVALSPAAGRAVLALLQAATRDARLTVPATSD